MQSIMSYFHFISQRQKSHFIEIVSMEFCPSFLFQLSVLLMVLTGINNVVLCGPFPPSTIVCHSWETKPSLEEPGCWFEPPSALCLVDIPCLCNLYKKTTQYQLISIHERLHGLFVCPSPPQTKGAYGSEPAIFLWPWAQSLSRVQCPESYLNVKYSTVSMSTRPSIHQQDFGKPTLW